MKTIEEILSESFGLSFRVFNYLYLFAGCIIFCDIAANEQVGLGYFWIPFLSMLLNLGLSIAATLCCFELFAQRPLPEMSQLGKRLDLMAFFENIWLIFRIVIVGIILMFLLVIPGLVYLVNRSLAFYVLNVERTTVSEALRKSKQLMTAEPWYSVSGPQMRLTGLAIVIAIFGVFVYFFSFLVIGAIYLFGALVGHKDGFSWVSSDPFMYTILFIVSILTVWVQIYQTAVWVSFYRDLLERYSENASPK